MSKSYRPAPPFSPVLLAGIAFRPLPPVLLQPGLNLALAALQRRHPGLFDRLSGLGPVSALIEPVDFPVSFLLRTAPPQLRALAQSSADQGSAAGESADAVIRGPLLRLIDLLEGRVDGDALFFSRELVVEGDTEVVVALRNAVDGAGIDLVADMLSALGPLAPPARTALGLARTVFARAESDLNTLRDALLAPARRHGEAQSARLEALENRINELPQGRGRSRSREASQ